jgi:hypothetical protein
MPGAVAAAERRLQVWLGFLCAEEDLLIMPAAAYCDRNAFRIRAASRAGTTFVAAVSQPATTCLTIAN